MKKLLASVLAITFAGSAAAAAVNPTQAQTHQVISAARVQVAMNQQDSQFCRNNTDPRCNNAG